MDYKKPDLKWMPLLGPFEQDGTDLIFKGYEYDVPPTPVVAADPASAAIEDKARPSKARSSKATASESPPSKMAAFGLAICGQRFVEGRIKAQIVFSETLYDNKPIVDIRSMAEIVLQYDPVSEEMLNVGIGGFSEKHNQFYLFSFRQFTSLQSAEANPSASSYPPKKGWKELRMGGEKGILRPNQPYDIEILVQGSSVSLTVNSVEVGRQELPFPLAGKQVGVLCLANKDIHIRNFTVEPVRPQAFIVMQFNTPEYEALYTDVFQPVCDSVGFRSYRADQTFLPGVVIADIARQIEKSRVIIAEITPVNANVYYEVGYADALGKPVILIANSTVTQLPFDVRPYRTIFYENSIGGKNKIESQLKKYLENIMAQQPLPDY